MQNVLLIRLKSIGDLVLTLPAVHVLRANYPSAKITFLTSKENAALLEGFRELDEVIALDRAQLRSGNPLRVVPEFCRLLYRLRAGRFSLVVDLQGYGETAWLTRITGAPERWGAVHRARRSWAYTRVVDPVPDVHPAEAHLRLLKQCGLDLGPVRNEFAVPAAAVNEARAWIAGRQFEATKPMLYIQPLTSGGHKNWPLENYLAVARHWRKAGAQIVFGGGPADNVALEAVRREGFAISAGMSLLVTAGLMQLSTLVLGGDTGALHLAVAEGKRVLMLMHQATPGSPMPFQHPEWVIAAPRQQAIAEIPVAVVNDAVARILNSPGGSGAC